jgi:hypothetical protein
MRGIKEKPGKEAIRLHSEKHACPRRGNPEARDARSSSARQTEEGGEGFWNTEQCDGDLESSWGTRIASEPLVPRETIMRPARPGTRGKARRLGGQRGAAPSAPPGVGRATTACTLGDGASGSSHATRRGADPTARGCEPHAHLTRLFGGAALPLTLLPQRAGAATAHAGRIDHAQAPIGLSAPLVRNKRLRSRGSAACHLAGGQSRGQRSGLVSRAGPLQLVHILARGTGRRIAPLARAREQEQTRSCAQEQDKAGGPVPGGGSTPIG